LSGSADATIKVWDLVNLKELKTLTGHSNKVTMVEITPDGAFGLSCSEDSTIKLWNIEMGQEIESFRESDLATSIAITPNAKFGIAGFGNLNIVKVFDLVRGEEIKNLKIHSGYVTSVSITPNGKYALCGSSDGFIYCWDLNTGKELINVKENNAGVVDTIMVIDHYTWASHMIRWIQ
jgi:WD40 repeat protein